MPKNVADVTKSKMRSKSTRKPLRDVSNAKTAVNSANGFKKISKDGGGQGGGDSLDRLLLVHSDLSSLLRQIDELVVQALQSTSNKGKKEIKQFADVLSDMLTSLKPWVPRLQKALLSQPRVPENKSEQSMERAVISVPEESTDAIVESPKQTKWESLVSPSPLVSWRAECNTEGGRQLFLLTPVPQTKAKAFSSKCTASSLCAFEKIALAQTSHPASLSDSVGDQGNDLPEKVSAKPTPNRSLDIEVSKGVGNLRPDCASPEKSSNTNYSLFVMTPCLKMSPPKSCILLEPISEFSRKKIKAVHKCTPFPAGEQNSSDSQDSETYSGGQSSDDLKLKYPELYGIKTKNSPKKMVTLDSPSWFGSPPKTCVILEPSDERLSENPSGNRLPLKTTAVHNQQDDFSMTRKERQDIIGRLDLAELTPMVKEPMSSIRMGKHPGENTLKKELWTKFEAASTHGIRFNSSLFQNTTRKGFLDQLDEASDA